MGSLFALPFKDQEFDCVICSQAIEHLPNDSQWCRELIRVLVPGGKLILGTPDYGTRSWPVIEWISGKVMPGAYAIEHFTHYTRTSLTELLAQHGFDPVACRYVLGSDMYISFRQRSTK